MATNHVSAWTRHLLLCQIFEDVQGMRMVDGGLQDFLVTFVKLAALDPVQFEFTPVDSVHRIVNRHAVGPNDFGYDDFLAIRPVHSGRYNVRLQSPIGPEEQSAADERLAACPAHQR